MSIEKEEIGRYVRRDVAWVDGNTSLREAIIRMAARDFDAVLVREKGEVAGIITDTDILNHIAAGKDLDKVKAREFMSKCELKGTSPCSQLSEDETVANAIKVMAGEGKHHVIVRDAEGNAIGVLSSRGLIKALKEVAGVC